MIRRTDNDGKRIFIEYDSLDEIADDIVTRGLTWSGASKDDGGEGSGWAGCSLKDALPLAHNGWDKHLAETLDIAESAVTLAERTHEIITTQECVFDVSGDFVDVGRYVSGEPECMVDFPLQSVSKSGKIIALCASVAYSSSIEPEVIRLRGQVITAMAIALTRLGHACELWVDISTKPDWSDNRELHCRVLVKGTDDILDPAKVLFAYSHPAMLRQLGLCEIETEIGTTFIPPGPPIHDLPEGTIYLPEILSSRNIPDAHEQLKGLLSDIGLLAE